VTAREIPYYNGLFILQQQKRKLELFFIRVILEMEGTETMETLIVMTEIFGRSPSSEATKNTHNVSKVGLALSSRGTGKGENLKHLLSNQKGMH
jgi:hypothetical protein